jgi:rod shape-determining protein MreD
MARSAVSAIIVTYALAVVQATVGGQLAVAGVAPDLLLVWTVCIGLLGGPRAGMIAGFACGFLEGSLLQRTIGALAAAKGLSGLAAGLISTRMLREHWLAPAIAAGLLTIANEVVFLALSDRTAGWAYAGRVLGVRTLYHAVLAPVMFAAAARARRELAGDRGDRLSHDA